MWKLDYDDPYQEVQRLLDIMAAHQAWIDANPNQWVMRKDTMLDPAQANWHRKHPSGDHCVECNSQWPCEESQDE